MDCTAISTSEKMLEKIVLSLLMRLRSTDSQIGWPAVLNQRKQISDADPISVLIDQINNLLKIPSAVQTLSDFAGLVTTFTGTTYIPPECCNAPTAETLLPVNSIVGGIIHIDRKV